jgi:hypothetical protein
MLCLVFVMRMDVLFMLAALKGSSVCNALNIIELESDNSGLDHIESKLHGTLVRMLSDALIHGPSPN